MLALKRSAGTAARRLRTTVPQQARRAAHDAAHDAAHAPTGSAEEHFGRGFYVAIAAVPVGLALYKFTTADKGSKPWLTRFIESYNYYGEKWAERNDLHVQIEEQLANDKLLFVTKPRKSEHELRNPESFNTGSPYNVPAGHYINLDAVIAKYEKQNFEEQRRKLEQLKNGTLECEQPLPDRYIMGQRPGK